MKFGKRLQKQIEETLPEWQDKFLSYKLLKKRLKMIAAECFNDHAFGQRQPATSSNDSSRSVNGPSNAVAVTVRGMGLTTQEIEFIRLLNLELEKFNVFFIEKEEEYVIRLQELKDRIERASVEHDENSHVDGKMLKTWKDLVTFHGEMVLLENYSSLNYTGLVKILKKHDKTTGALLRLPFIQKVLHQPFYTTELLSKLVRDCESSLQSIFPLPSFAETVNEIATSTATVTATAASAAAAAPTQQQEEEEEDDDDDDDRTEEDNGMESIYRSTVAALHTIQELRKSSSSSYNNLSVREEPLGAVVDESTVSC